MEHQNDFLKYAILHLNMNKLGLEKYIEKELYNILSENTGQPYETIQQDCDRDNWMMAADALTYGLVDEVLGRDKI